MAESARIYVRNQVTVQSHERQFLKILVEKVTTVRSKILVRLRNMVIFEDLQNKFRPKNRNIQNFPI